MRSRFISALAVIGAVTVLVLAANTVALATTGKAILAGKSNTAGTVTSIVRTTPGTALQVQTKSTANAPFAVNGTGKVANLNADRIDGLDSARLLTKPYVIRKVVNSQSGTLVVQAPGSLPVGYYALSYSVALSTASESGSPDIGGIRCYAATRTTAGGTEFVAGSLAVGATGNTIASVSGSGVVYKRTAGDALGITCLLGTSAPYTSLGQQPVQLVFTRLDGVVASNQ